MKKAFLVDISLRTRVVVDIADECGDKDPQTNDGLWAEIADKAMDKIEADLDEYLNYDNVTEVFEDTECPAGTFSSDLL